MSALLDVVSVGKTYKLRGGLFRAARAVPAVEDVSFSLGRGGALGIVGESGSGKSTLARMVVSLETPSAGEIRFDGVPLSALSPGELRRKRRHIQMVFQDPGGSFNPRKRIGRVLSESLRLAGRETPASELLEQVGLPVSFLDRHPHELSGGQLQRVAIARALAMRPDVLVADEATSALDVSLQAQILHLFTNLRDRLGLALIVITHDLALVHHLCDDVIVMRAGRVVERGAPCDVLRAPRHEYTRTLLDAIPRGPRGQEV